MSNNIKVDGDNGIPIPTQAFLNMLIVMLRNAVRETGMDLIEYLELVGQSNDPTAMRKNIHEFMDKHYPPKVQGYHANKIILDESTDATDSDEEA